MASRSQQRHAIMDLWGGLGPAAPPSLALEPRTPHEPQPCWIWASCGGSPQVRRCEPAAASRAQPSSQCCGAVTMPRLRWGPTLAVQADVHHSVLDLHVPAEVALQVELAGAVGTLEGLAASVQVHVPQQVVHAVEGLPADLRAACPPSAPRAGRGSAAQTWPPGSPGAPTKSNLGVPLGSCQE